MTEPLQIAQIAGHDLIARGTDTRSLQQRVACFPRLKETRPNTECVLDLDALYNLVIANGRPGIWPDKSLLPMVLLGELRVAPYTGNTAKKYPGQSGKQRSGTHVARYGPGIMFDIDGVPVAEIEKALQTLGLAYIVYTSYSSAEESRDKKGKVKAKGRGRLILFLDGTWCDDDHQNICRVIDRVVLGGIADPGAFNRGQGFYTAGLKHQGQEFYHNASHGQLLSLQAVLAHAPKRGRSNSPAVINARSERAKATPEEAVLQEAREIGAMGCVDDEPHWFRTMNSIKREWLDRPCFALHVADALSGVAANYKGRGDVQAKMTRDDGEVKTRFDYVQWWGKQCAIAIIERANTDTSNVLSPRSPDGTPIKVSPLAYKLKHAFDELAPGIKQPKEAPAHLSTAPDNVRRAALYLSRWWPPGVIDGLFAKYPALAAHAAEIEAAKAEQAAVYQERRAEVRRNGEAVMAQLQEAYDDGWDKGDSNGALNTLEREIALLVQRDPRLAYEISFNVASWLVRLDWPAAVARRAAELMGLEPVRADRWVQKVLAEKEASHVQQKA